MAGSGRRTFAAGEVLTASNVMNYLQDQAVMNFAGTAARGSAIGTAVAAEGMVTYLKDSNLIESYSGSAWERQTGGLVPILPASYTPVSGSASMNAVGTVSFTNVTSLSLNGIFSATYTNYRIVMVITSSPSTGWMIGKFVQAGSIDSTANQNRSYIYNDGSLNTAATGSSTGGFISRVTSGSNTHPCFIDVSTPFLSGTFSGYFATWLYGGWAQGMSSVGYLANKSFDGFNIAHESAGAFSGTITVYGYVAG